MHLKVEFEIKIHECEFSHQKRILKLLHCGFPSLNCYGKAQLISDITKQAYFKNCIEILASFTIQINIRFTTKQFGYLFFRERGFIFSEISHISSSDK